MRQKEKKYGAGVSSYGERARERITLRESRRHYRVRTGQRIYAFRGYWATMETYSKGLITKPESVNATDNDVTDFYGKRHRGKTKTQGREDNLNHAYEPERIPLLLRVIRTERAADYWPGGPLFDAPSPDV